ncbi:hypothetical protein [Rhizobium rhizogenes]
MSQEPSFTFYTYSAATKPEEQRWAYTGIPDNFFGDIHSARAAVLELRNDIIDDPDGEWPRMHIERIETLPVSQDTLLAFLNDGVAALIKRYEIVETIE